MSGYRVKSQHLHVKSSNPPLSNAVRYTTLRTAQTVVLDWCCQQKSKGRLVSSYRSPKAKRPIKRNFVPIAMWSFQIIIAGARVRRISVRIANAAEWVSQGWQVKRKETHTDLSVVVVR